MCEIIILISTKKKEIPCTVKIHNLVFSFIILPKTIINVMASYLLSEVQLSILWNCCPLTLKSSAYCTPALLSNNMCRMCTGYYFLPPWDLCMSSSTHRYVLMNVILQLVSTFQMCISSLIQPTWLDKQHPIMKLLGCLCCLGAEDAKGTLPTQFLCESALS